MELSPLNADGEGIRALFLVHLSDFTTDHSLDQGQVDEAFLERCVMTPKDVGYFFPRLTLSASRSASFSPIGKFLAARRALRAIRAFNLRDVHEPGPDAYQASHFYSLAEHMLSDEGTLNSGPGNIGAGSGSIDERESCATSRPSWMFN